MQNTENKTARTVRALSLMSGGLDSQLAVCILRDQGIDVEGVVFQSPFFDISPAVKAARQLGIKLHIRDFTNEIMALLEKPPHGFGSCMNPCIDCHAKMLNVAGEMLKELGFDFLSTGEVLGQRPMSQRRQALDIVAKGSGVRDLILRPLSAKLLPPTKMEEDGLVDRERLLALEGRNRKPQMELAKKFNLKDYPSPAGGCKLTEPNYSKRLKELKEHEGLDGNLSLVNLLRLGRHLRLPGGARVVAGRNKADNEAIRASAAPKDYLLRSVDVPGPTLLVSAGASDEDIETATGICASYADTVGRDMITVRIQKRNVPDREVRVRPLEREIFTPWIM